MIINTILITLVVYSLISVIIYFLSGENDEVLEIAGLGIVGWLLIGFMWIIAGIVKYFKHFSKRSIFEDKKTGNKYICKLKDANNILHWMDEYKIIKRYANKREWKNIPYFSKEIIEKSKINCDYCKHYQECDCDYPYDKVKCTHDNYGRVLNFDSFERNRGRK